MMLGILLTLRPEACFEVNQNAAREPDHAVAAGANAEAVGQRRSLLFGEMAAGMPLNDDIAALKRASRGHNGQRGALPQ